MMAGEFDDGSQSPQAMDHPPIHILNSNATNFPTQTQGRFSRYLRFARRRQNRWDGQSEIRECEPENAHGHGRRLVMCWAGPKAQSPPKPGLFEPSPASPPVGLNWAWAGLAT